MVVLFLVSSCRHCSSLPCVFVQVGHSVGRKSAGLHSAALTLRLRCAGSRSARRRTAIIAVCNQGTPWVTRLGHSPSAVNCLQTMPVCEHRQETPQLERSHNTTSGVFPPVFCWMSLRLLWASFDFRRCSDFMFSFHRHIVVHVLCLPLHCANAKIRYNFIFCLVLFMQHCCVPLFASFTSEFFYFNVHLPGFPVSFIRSCVWNHRYESNHLLRCSYRCL